MMESQQEKVLEEVKRILSYLKTEGDVNITILVDSYPSEYLSEAKDGECPDWHREEVVSMLCETHTSPGLMYDEAIHTSYRMHAEQGTRTVLKTEYIHPTQ